MQSQCELAIRQALVLIDLKRKQFDILSACFIQCICSIHTSPPLSASSQVEQHVEGGKQSNVLRCASRNDVAFFCFFWH